MKIKVSEATPIQLNWLVAKCEGVSWSTWLLDGYATDWAQGGPIIEREEIELTRGTENSNGWTATIDLYEGDAMRESCTGPTPLIAAMRCYVASKLGEECDIPDELMKEDKPDWRDPNSGCYCVVCLAPVREDIFVQRAGCCPNHKFDDECTYR